MILGGLDEKLKEIKETIRISFTKQEMFIQSGLIPVKVRKFQEKSGHFRGFLGHPDLRTLWGWENFNNQENEAGA